MRPDTAYAASAELALAPGDLVLLVTDGLDESLSPGDEIFGIERVLDVVRGHRDKPAQDIVRALYQAVRGFSQANPQTDDVTAIVLKVKPAAA